MPEYENPRRPRPANAGPARRADAARRRRAWEKRRRRALARYYAVLALLALLAVALVVGAVLLVRAVFFAKPQDASSAPPPPDSAAVSQSASPPAAPDASSAAQPAASGPADPTLWSLLLINTAHPLPDGYEPSLTLIGSNARNGGSYVDERISQPLADMIAAAKQDGIALIVRSAYRSHSDQTMLFNQMKQNYMNGGMSEEEALAATKKLRNVPGTSEHESGLCVDIVGEADLNASLEPELSERDWAVWLKAHAAEYGFILRYPADKTDITGTSFEPWHYRYVGTQDAANIMADGLCLEEYLGILN